MDFNLVLEDSTSAASFARAFFEPTQLLSGFLISDFVPFAFHGVLGAMDRKTLLMQKAANLVPAEANSAGLGQMCSQAGRGSRSPRFGGLVRTALASISRKEGVAWLGRPDGLIGINPSKPC
jgi:hypothetical protein